MYRVIELSCLDLDLDLRVTCFLMAVLDRLTDLDFGVGLDLDLDLDLRTAVVCGCFIGNVIYKIKKTRWFDRYLELGWVGHETQ